MPSSPNIGDDHRHRLDKPDDLLVVDDALIVGSIKLGASRIGEQLCTLVIVTGWLNNDDLPEAGQTLILDPDHARAIGESLIRSAESATALAAEREAEEVRLGAIDALKGGE